MRMQMDDLLTFFQSTTEKEFIIDDDSVIEQLQICMEELKKAKMSIPPKAKNNESPTLPFGMELQPSVEQLIGKKSQDTVDEHFRKNTSKPAGKAAYLRRKNQGGSFSGGHNNQLGTPDISRSRGADTRSIHSRLSQYSIDGASSYYDTATNSRISYSAKTSAPSSRTSFGEQSDLGSLAGLQGHGFHTPIDLEDELDMTMPASADIATPTTPTNPPLTATHTDHVHPAMTQSLEMPRGTQSVSDQMSTNMKSSASYELPAQANVISRLDMSPRQATHTHFQHTQQLEMNSSVSHVVSEDLDSTLVNQSNPLHTSYLSESTSFTSPSDETITPRQSESYDVEYRQQYIHHSAHNIIESHPTDAPAAVIVVEPAMNGTNLHPIKSPSPGSIASDYDNIDNLDDETADDTRPVYSGSNGVAIIPMSRSDGFVSAHNVRSSLIGQTENSRSNHLTAGSMVVVNGHGGDLSTQTKLVHSDVGDMRRSKTIEGTQITAGDFNQQLRQIDRQNSYVTESKPQQTRRIERTAYL